MLGKSKSNFYLLVTAKKDREVANSCVNTAIKVKMLLLQFGGLVDK